MPRPALSVGSMMSFALDGVARVGGEHAVHGERRTRREVFARGLLAYVLSGPKARQAFSRHAAGVSATVHEFRTMGRSGPVPFDLVASVDGGAQLGVAIRVDGEVDPDAVRALLADLPTDDSRLLLITPRSSRAGSGLADDRLVTITWPKLAKRLADKDPKRAELWVAIGEFGEDAGPLAVRRPVSPRLLVEEDVTAQMRAHLATFRLVADELFGRPARFSGGRRGASLQVGMTAGRLGAEFGSVEDGTPGWLVGARPHRAFCLRLGALDDASRPRAEARLRAIAAGEQWRSDPEYAPHLGEFIGEPASAELESARALLWEVFDPRRLATAGFPLVARNQPDLDERRLAVRVAYPEDPKAGTFLVAIGGSKTWKTLLPRVTREYDAKTYIVQAGKRDTAQDLITGVHEALRSLATKP